MAYGQLHNAAGRIVVCGVAKNAPTICRSVLVKRQSHCGECLICDCYHAKSG